MRRLLLCLPALALGCVAPDSGRCGADPWAEAFGAGERVVYVSPDGWAGAAGTQTTPLDSISTAMGRLGDEGGAIALLEGRHPGPGFVEPTASLRIVGACREGTVLIAPDGPADEFLDGEVGWFSLGGYTTPGVDLELSRLSVEGGGGVAFEGIEDARAVLRDVEIRDAIGRGLLLQTPSFLAEDLHVTGVRPSEPVPEGRPSYGGATAVSIRSNRMNDAVLRGVLIDDIEGWGVIASGSVDMPMFELQDVTVRGIRPPGPTALGTGIELVSRVVAELEGTRIEDVVGRGLLLGGSSEMQVDGLTIRDVRGGWARNSGRGVVLGFGGHLDARSLLVEDTDGPGISLLSRSAARLDAPVLRRNGFAAISQLQGTLEVDGGSIEEPSVSPDYGGGVGVFLWGDFPWAEVSASDIGMYADIRGTRFTGMPRSAVYARGWENDLFVDGIEVTDAWSGVFAGWTDTPRWGELRVTNSRFRDLAGDAVLLDGFHRVRTEGNSVESIGGEPLVRQRCGSFKERASTPAPGGVPADLGADCGGIRRETRPMLVFDGRVYESSIAE